MNGFDYIEEVQKILRNNGSRVTPQREYILEAFVNNKDDHLSAEDIHAILQKDNYKKQISLATIYRTLNTLTELGILREVDLAQDHMHYELADQDDNTNHHHIICMNCDHHNAIEFVDQEVEELALKIATRYNVTLKQVELKIKGICNEK